MPYKNKEDRAAQAAKYRDKNFVLLWELLSKSKCVDCGHDDPRVLEFDHRPGVEKKFEIGRAVGGSTRSWALILTEIAKCDIVCSNCHRVRTLERGGFKRYHAPIA